MTRSRLTSLPICAVSQRIGFYSALLFAVLAICSRSQAQSTDANKPNSQPPQTLSVAADSPRWELEGQAKVTEYQGRKCLFLDGGAATVKTLKCATALLMWTSPPPQNAAS